MEKIISLSEWAANYEAENKGKKHKVEYSDEFKELLKHDPNCPTTNGKNYRGKNTFSKRNIKNKLG